MKNPVQITSKVLLVARLLISMFLLESCSKQEDLSKMSPEELLVWALDKQKQDIGLQQQKADLAKEKVKLDQQAGEQRKQQEEWEKRRQQEEEEQEKRVTEEAQRIGEKIRKIAEDQPKLDEFIKTVAHNGETIVDQLTKRLNCTHSGTKRGGFYEEAVENCAHVYLDKGFTEVDIAVLIAHPRFRQTYNISLGNRKLSTASLKIFAPQLNELSNLKTLSLFNVQLGVAGMKILAPCLEGLKLDLLALTNNQIDDEAIQIFVPYLGGLKNLDDLILSNNQIGDIGIKALTPCLIELMKSANLESITLTGNQIRDAGMEFLASHLKGLRNTQNFWLHFKLEHNQIGDTGARSLGLYLKEEKDKTIYLTNNNLTTETKLWLKQQCPLMCWSL